MSVNNSQNKSSNEHKLSIRGNKNQAIFESLRSSLAKKGNRLATAVTTNILPPDAQGIIPQITYKYASDGTPVPNSRAAIKAYQDQGSTSNRPQDQVESEHEAAPTARNSTPPNTSLTPSTLIRSLRSPPQTGNNHGGRAINDLETAEVEELSALKEQHKELLAQKVDIEIEYEELTEQLADLKYYATDEAKKQEDYDYPAEELEADTAAMKERVREAKKRLAIQTSEIDSNIREQSETKAAAARKAAARAKEDRDMARLVNADATILIETVTTTCDNAVQSALKVNNEVIEAITDTDVIKFLHHLNIILAGCTGDKELDLLKANDAWGNCTMQPFDKQDYHKWLDKVSQLHSNFVSLGGDQAVAVPMQLAQLKTLLNKSFSRLKETWTTGITTPPTSVAEFFSQVTTYYTNVILPTLPDIKRQAATAREEQKIYNTLVKDKNKNKKQPPVCKNYRDKGECRFGDKCHFQHQMQANMTTTTNTPLCFRMIHSGTCTDGDNCQYKRTHDMCAKFHKELAESNSK